MRTQFKVKCTAVSPVIKKAQNGQDQKSHLADFALMLPDDKSPADEKRLFTLLSAGSLRLAFSENGLFVKDTTYYLLISDEKTMFQVLNA